ncbi:MAG: DsbA family protein [Hyphomicrobium sp.]|nr:DsbA family protein [Hyphomicrobium sp.]
MFASKTPSGRFELARRAALAALCAGALGAAVALPVAAQSKGPTEVPVEELMKPVGLPELALGPIDAKVTVVEYASMTCGHCAHFSKDIWPAFKAKYVDTGKVRYVFREFPLDNLAAAAAMLARCAGGDKAFPLVEVLFEKQQEWAFGEGNPVPRLFEIANRRASRRKRSTSA